MRLLDIAKATWQRFDGWAVERGVDPMALPFDRFLNFIHHYATDGGDEAEIDQFETRLYMPPPSQKRKPVRDYSKWSKANEEAAFGGLAAALRGAAT